ncbi:RidA family protein [Occultella glacieicola]|uniref:RidA family protein n=1 Tax=Occultella glacieicola TaxID=2518684 RepID=A0ABY2E3G1_9MICO|nr:RidA family protein [Occultella glacieicola]TDE92656.1 RidA family protein [Occultella glacieicola]
MNQQSITKRTLTEGLPQPAGPYSHVATIGDLVLTAGFGPQDPLTGAVPDGVAAQTDAVLANVATALGAVGADLDDVLKVTVHLADVRRDFAEFNTAYATHFDAPYPVRTTVGSDLPGILVEIDVVARRGPEAR